MSLVGVDRKWCCDISVLLHLGWYLVSVIGVDQGWCLVEKRHDFSLDS